MQYSKDTLNPKFHFKATWNILEKYWGPFCSLVYWLSHQYTQPIYGKLKIETRLQSSYLLLILGKPGQGRSTGNKSAIRLKRRNNDMDISSFVSSLSLLSFIIIIILARKFLWNLIKSRYVYMHSYKKLLSEIIGIYNLLKKSVK